MVRNRGAAIIRVVNPSHTDTSMLLRLLARRTRTFARMPVMDKALFVHAYLLLGVARCAIQLLPFRHIAPRLGEHIRMNARSHILDRDTVAEARRIGRLVRLAARYTPWESVCLIQALTATALLERKGIPYTAYLGVAKAEEPGIKAHAWVTAGPVHVTGSNGFMHYTPVSAFSSQTRAPRNG